MAPRIPRSCSWTVTCTGTWHQGNVHLNLGHTLAMFNWFTSHGVPGSSCRPLAWACIEAILSAAS